MLALLEECGPVTGLLHEYEVKLAAEICPHFPAVDLFRMLGSGSEAVMAAIRVARAHTGRKWIIKTGLRVGLSGAFENSAMNACRIIRIAH